MIGFEKVAKDDVDKVIKRQPPNKISRMLPKYITT